MHSTSNVRKTILSNGLTVLTERMENLRSVSMGIWLKSGARHDRREHNGLSHFVEHMVFKGTTTRSARQISLHSDDIGGGLNALTTQEMVIFHTKVLDTHVASALELLADLILNPNFPPDEIDRERTVILEEINASKDDPGDLAHDAFVRTLWRDDSLALPIAGTPDTISAFTRDTLVHYANQRFTGTNLAFVAAGHLQHDDLVEKVEHYFGRAPAGVPLPCTNIPRSSSGQTFVESPTEQMQMVLGFPAPPINDIRLYITHVTAMLLGGGPSSRLFQSIREERGLAYDVAAAFIPLQNAGYFSVYTGASRSKIERVLNLILHELRCVKAEPVSSRDLRRIKELLINSEVIGMETSGSRASALGNDHLNFGRSVSLEERIEGVEGVTANQVMSLANELFDPARMALALVGDIQGLQLSLDRLTC